MSRKFLLLAFALLLFANRAQAEIIVSVNDAQVPLGGDGEIEVFLANTGPGSVNIGEFGFQLEIAPSASTLRFAAVQEEAQLGDTQYIFDGHLSLALFIGATNPLFTDDDTYTGGDSLFNENALIGPGESKLLFRLNLESTGVDLSETFTVSIVPGSPQNVLSEIVFVDDNGTPGDPSDDNFALSPIDFTIGAAGTVTLVEPTAVIPEPGSMLLWGLGTVACGGYRLFRRRKAA